MATTYTYKCMKASCQYQETYGKPGSHKCPKCNSAMLRK